MNPKEFVSGYSNVKTKEAAAGKAGATGDSKDNEEDDNPLYEEDIFWPRLRISPMMEN